MSSLTKKAKLLVKYLLANLGHELLKQAATIDAILDLIILVDELNSEIRMQIDLVLVDVVEGVLKDVVAANSDLGTWLVPAVPNLRLQLLQLVCENFGTDSEWITLWNILQYSVAQKFGHFLKF